MRFPVGVLPFKYWKRYLDQFTYFGEHVYRGMLQGYQTTRLLQQVKYYVEPPYSAQFEQKNIRDKKKMIYVEPIDQSKWVIFPGDYVQVLKGRDKGRRGRVYRVVRERNWVFVGGANLDLTYSGGEVTRLLKPLLFSLNPDINQVALVDPEDQQACEADWMLYDDGSLMRVSHRSKRSIPLPKSAFTYEDGVNPLLYNASEKDTADEKVSERTFQPRLATFEQDIMESMGIDEMRTRRSENFWY